MDILKKFIELTEYTHILGEEHEMEHFLPSNVTRDSIGNYYLKIGDNNVMFTCHLDTAAHKKNKVTHYIENEEDDDRQTFVGTDGNTILGADDRTGLLIMLYMIQHDVPGLYYFFIGEERGTVGSSGILRKDPDFFNDYKKCISFDRRGYGSVITKQYGTTCCSKEFASKLVEELCNKSPYIHKEDPTGIYTDSAVFMDNIPECTNLSVGYFNEHTTKEHQNITYLEEMCKTFVDVDWVGLPVERKNEVYDTPNPYRRIKKSNDISDNELTMVFNVVNEVMEDAFEMECLNGFNFIPEKEMIYEDMQGHQMSVFIHDDGSITVGKDRFMDLEEFGEELKNYYNYDISKIYNSYEEEEEDDTEELFINDEDDIFEEGLNMDKFIKDVIKLLHGDNEGYIEAVLINKLLDKYNRTLDGLITWLYNNDNDPRYTHGLIWDDDKNKFYFYDL